MCISLWIPAACTFVFIHLYVVCMYFQTFIFVLRIVPRAHFMVTLNSCENICSFSRVLLASQTCTNRFICTYKFVQSIICNEIGHVKWHRQSDTVTNFEIKNAIENWFQQNYRNSFWFLFWKLECHIIIYHLQKFSRYIYIQIHIHDA